MFSRLFWIEACERALKSAGQFGAGALGTVAWTDIEQIAPAGQVIVYAMLFGIIASFLTSMGSVNIGEKGTPSLVSSKE